MEIEGTIVFDLPLQEGVSKAGKPWKKKEWVLETPGMYPRKVKFHVFGDRVDQMRFELGKSYVCQCDVESREFNGRWYTDVSVYSARESGMETPQQAAPAQNQSFGAPAGGFGAQAGGFGAAPAPAAPAADPFAGGDNNTDDLPF